MYSRVLGRERGLEKLSIAGLIVYQNRLRGSEAGTAQQLRTAIKDIQSLILS